jgi:hypothetical protein
VVLVILEYNQRSVQLVVCRLQLEELQHLIAALELPVQLHILSE